MFNFLRNKTILNLIMLICVGMMIGAVHNRELERGQPFVVQDSTRSMLAPVEMAAHHVFGAAKVATSAFRPRSMILKENARLRKQVRQLTLENSRLKEAAVENIRLRRELTLETTSKLDLIPGELISRDVSTWFDSATISCGRQAGVEAGAAVINHMGLMGQVSDANPFTSQIVALTDSTSAVGAMVQRSRASGILQGQGADYLVLAYLPKDADVKAKDIVVSSGMGGVIPKGLVIGRVVGVKRNSTAGTTAALVKPSVHFDEVEQVFVVKPGQNPAQ